MAIDLRLSQEIVQAESPNRNIGIKNGDIRHYMPASNSAHSNLLNRYGRIMIEIFELIDSNYHNYHMPISYAFQYG